MLAVLVLPLTACLHGNQNGPHVDIVGDSITRLSVPDLDRTLTVTYYIDTAANDGQRIDQMVPSLVSNLSGDAPVHDVVENLGTNDAIQNYTGWRTGWNAFIADVASVPCVVLVTVNTLTDSDYGHGTVAADLNTAISSTAAGNPTLYRVVDWNAAVTASAPSYSLLAGDLVHPSSTGEQWIADQTKAALDTCPA